jgi:hypothetical protein
MKDLQANPQIDPSGAVWPLLADEKCPLSVQSPCLRLRISECNGRLTNGRKEHWRASKTGHPPVSSLLLRSKTYARVEHLPTRRLGDPG